MSTDNLSPARGSAAQFADLNFVAQRVGLSTKTVRRAISSGDLPGYRFGKALRVKLTDVDRWVESKAMPNARTRRRGGAS